MDLQNSNISKSVNAGVISNKLSGLKWITPQYPNNPEQEISKLQEAIKIIKCSDWFIEGQKKEILCINSYDHIENAKMDKRSIERI